MEITTKLILEFLEKIGSQLTQSVVQVFEIYTRHAYASGIKDLTISCIALFIAIISALVGLINLRSTRKVLEAGLKEDSGPTKAHNSKESWHQFIMFFGFVSMVINLCVFGAYFSDGIQYVINPQYYAAQELIGVVRNAVK